MSKNSKRKIRTLTVRKAWRVCEGPEADVVGAPVTCADDAASALSFLRDASTEEFWAVLLNAKHKIIGLHRVSIGCLTWSVVHPREVFTAAVREGAAAVIVAHNHPSGDPTPSADDYDVTERLKKAGDVLGIPVLDHIVLGDYEHVSILRPA